MSEKLYIHRLCQNGTHALGPGLRYVIWVQGCPFSCEKCLTPEGQRKSNANYVFTEDLANDIVARTDIEGISISGGEPFMQAKALTEVVEMVRQQRPDLDVIIFTGYLLEQLNTPESKALLNMADLLIDGPYVDNLNDGKGLRGSSNQKLHFLTPKLLEHKDELENGKRALEMRISTDEMITIGIPSKNYKNTRINKL